MRIMARYKTGHRAAIEVFATVLWASLLLLIGCGQQQITKKSEQETFASPEDAGTVLLEAAKTNDRAKILSIFGPQANQTIFSGDAVKDKANFEEFVAAYTQMHRWIDLKVGGEMLVTSQREYRSGYS